MHVVQILSTIILFSFTSIARAQCPYPGWEEHRLKVIESPSHSLINASTTGMSRKDNYFGFEGGAAVKVNGVYYVFTTEFYAKPRFVPSHLAVWSSDAHMGRPDQNPWWRVATIFSSSGVVETDKCTDPRGSLGSSVSPIYNAALGYWEIFYVGFHSCCPKNETVHHFYNRYGRQYHARSTIHGLSGIAGPYHDIDVVLAPEDDDRQLWEGLMGVDSMSPPYRAHDGKWYAFYGSAKTEDGTGQSKNCLPTVSNNNTDQERVGLATSDKIEGPWRRVSEGNPVSLEFPNNHTEQPIVTQFSDGTYGAVFDALDHETEGSVGYAWSPDGVRWHPQCGQHLTVAGAWGKARTPLGLIEEEDNIFTLLYTGYDIPAEAKNGPHESLGFARVAFG